MKIKEIVDKHFSRIDITGVGGYSLNTDECVAELKEAIGEYIRNFTNITISHADDVELAELLTNFKEAMAACIDNH